MGPLETFGGHLEELTSSFDPAFVVGGNGIGLTQYIAYAILICVLVLLAVILAGKNLTLVPENKLVNIVEYGYQCVRKNISEDSIGKDYKRHVPFLATMFFFILGANVVGLIPGAKAATGTLSVTWALSTISFFYFNYWGVKAHGGLGYIKHIAPSGLPTVMVPVIWFFEFFSLVLRWLTLAVRLYGNMFAGHMVLGIFALLTSVFIGYAIDTASFAAALPAIGWFAFLAIMYALECLVAFLQAYVFTTLSAVYIDLAISDH